MRAEHHRNAVEFLEVVGAHLRRNVPRNQLILGVLEQAAEQPDVYPEYHGWLVDSAGEPVALASCTPPYNYIIGDAVDEDALQTLVEAVARSGVIAPGALGNRPSIEAFVTAWSAETGGEAEFEMGQGVFNLDRVEPLALTKGLMREATPDDKPLMVAWMHAFFEEAVPGDPVGDPELRINDRLDPDKPQGVSLWEVEGEVVSMSGYSHPVSNSIRIGPVYTPPELRGKGYATALVSSQSQRFLDAGRDRCLLHTDLANPTSNAIYKRIGYYQVAEMIVYKFVD